MFTAGMHGHRELTDEQNRRRFRAARSGPRPLMMSAGGVVIAVLVGVFGKWVFALVAGWAAAALVFNLWVWLAAARMERRADGSSRHP